MSARYSNSPALRLEIARSRIYCLLHFVFCLLTIVGLYRIDERGYPVLALLLLPMAALCCWQTARQTLAGGLVRWERGQWYIGGEREPGIVTLERSSTCLPWVIYLAWVDPARLARGSALLFPDSVPVDDLRRLRVRLTLQR